MIFSTAVSLSLATLLTVQAAPVYNSNASTESVVSYSENVFGWANPQLPEIYHTCNATNVRMLNAAFADSLEASAYAKSRLTEYGVDDVLYKRWFGNGSAFTVMGVLDQLMESSKDGVLLRCDDVDGLCAANPDYYAGHHRESAPSETVICDYFYSSKKPLSTMCFEGNLVDVHPKHYAGIDMLHRYLHVPKINLGIAGEYAEELDEILDLAENNSSYAVLNADNILYYIADVYSSSVIPGGCLGSLSE